jgi:hypothetical protein
MKAFLVLSVLALSGCGLFSTSEGVFNGRVVDVAWEGFLFKSCEVDFQLGQQSSSVSKGATKDKAFCDRLKAQVGQVVTVKYNALFPPPLTMSSHYEISE